MLVLGSFTSSRPGRKNNVCPSSFDGGGTILVLWMALKDLFFAATMLLLSIESLTSGVGAVARCWRLGVPSGS
jgi:hypothetical protein